ncbi:MAG TPA: NAD(P)-dependent oxidoreductase [Bacteroidia bacterium]|nr:NAD(P)-dependent oxidoreductase [Bacteroidia bacterium]HRS59195.1 NAD(P)-dependent oxidoreductase [Bacteroidia bacterium]HRU67243.1 NAD(P)-dependent oxidoreductase [Bacteroidia bacterium]
MKKVLVATEKPFAKIAVDGIREVLDKAGYELLLLEKYKEQADLLKAVEEVDALIIRSDIVDKAVVDAAKNLKIVVRAGAGYDNIDLAACTSKNIVAMNTPGQNSNAVAELAIGMMIYMARNKFDGSSGTELRDKTLGLHAFGYVGKYVAAIAKGFNMKIYAFDPFLKKEDFEKEGVIPVSSVEELYRSCSYVSLHIPANAQTKKSIGYDLLKLMPENANLVNTARKEVIDEEGLLKIFEERADFRYMSDIEPECKDILLEKYAKRVYFTPKKMGAQTEEANINAGIAAARQIVNFFEQGDIRFKVN